jgi:outer membrane protein TolC
VTLAVRLAYFQAKVNSDQVRLLADSLKIAQDQYIDIGHQAKFGTASRMDLLSSHQEVLNLSKAIPAGPGQSGPIACGIFSRW